MNSESNSRPQSNLVIQNVPMMTVPMNPELKALEKARIEKLFPKKMRRILSFIQLYFGGIAGLLQIILVGMASKSGGEADYGTGIWCGLVIGIAGGIGLIATNRPSLRSVKALLVLSIFATIFAMILMFISWSGIQTSRRGSNYVEVAMFCILVLIGLAEGIVSVINVAYACQVCSGTYETRMTSGHVTIPVTSTTASSSTRQSAMLPQNSNAFGASAPPMYIM